MAATARGSMTAALDSAEAQILASPVPEREGRVSPRAIHTPASPCPSAETRKTPIPRHASYAVTITAPGTATQDNADQHKQPGNQLSDPP
jgi:hypothetical protein